MDQAAYEAGQGHARTNGMSCPDMETEWKKFGRRDGKVCSRTVGSSSFPADAHLTHSGHWDFSSWEQGFTEGLA